MALLDDAAKVKITIRPIAGERHFNRKVTSAKLSSRSPVVATSALRLVTGQEPPKKIEVEIEWVVGRKKVDVLTVGVGRLTHVPVPKRR